MVLRGKVQNGVIVLEGDKRFPEGQEVLVHEVVPREEKRHSVLDIPTVSVGGIIRPLTSDDDLLGEMLEGKRI